MENHPRAKHRRRFFTADFERERLAWVERQEVAVAELARDLVISPAVVRRWHPLSTAGNAAAVGATEARGR